MLGTERKAGGEQKFTVNVSIPKDAERGDYSAVIAFTNETILSAQFPREVFVLWGLQEGIIKS